MQAEMRAKAAEDETLSESVFFRSVNFTVTEHLTNLNVQDVRERALAIVKRACIRRHTCDVTYV
jgi:hypothetical protein